VNFADTNWLEAMFFASELREKQARRAIVDRLLRQHGGQIGLSHIVYLEARNIFSRVSGESEPEEWGQLQAGLNGRFYLDPMNWEFLRRDTFALVAKYAHKATLGTFDLALLASAKLAGATRLLSFDDTLKAMALAEGLPVFPELGPQGKTLLAQLRR
jgi:predicted nucleic acid-binding protein